MSAATPAGRLAGKVALVTGGGGGIGAATTRLFCEQGAAVMLVDLDPAALERTAQAVRAERPEARIEVLAGDVADPGVATAAVRACEQAFGQLDVLVNNAAMRNYSSFAEATPEEWQAVIGVNMLGNAQFCRAALPLLRRAGRGAIVNVSSCYAVKGRKGMALYDATKSAMLAMTRTLAFEEADHGVRVNVVCPGSTLTDFHVNRTRAAGRSVEDLKTQRQDTSLLGRWAEPMEIAYPILWLASDEGSFITGTTLVVDGGLHVK
ncbi:SDR family NAD(P)-dependent oxidoreductase [Ramlibacter rhizophilus]|uniref:SDR family oxidoreductase n=1 Tax=Ramlibacter rhizophilus TaxID=1781167 RepID=A0A4Z0BSM4_9BURK|nr:SDR family NAD(P)-dependent oxidoreductase [Ramlibacter rhizophilus]TFZ01258.1 SDR family oxidoreductase [Ramlibacter rhizophilus]